MKLKAKAILRLSLGLGMLALAFLVAGGQASFGATTNLLVPAGSVWKYLDDGSDQGTAWLAPTFDDSSWPSGPAQFGFGEADERTLLRFGTNSKNKYITYYFRTYFNS